MEIIVKASEIQEGLLEQLQEVISENEWLFKGEKIVLMADAHIGYTVPIGYTQTVSNPERWVSPEFVSSDIGCGVTSYLFDGILNREQLAAIDTFINKNIPIHRNAKQRENGRLFPNSFGTLGGGNHFIEIGECENQTLLSVHSGSRAMGGTVHEKYSINQKELEYEQKRTMMIEQLKKEERHAEIEKELENISKSFERTTISVVRGWDGYFQEMQEAVEWAQDSRRKILNKIVRFMEEKLYDITYLQTIESIHNYIELDAEVPIIRKGSISAPFGKEVVIPLNMKDGIILGISAVDENVNFSLPHGAGRKRSRTRAFKELNFKDFKTEMEGVVSTSVVQKTLDEAPGAYKDKEVILKDITPYLSEYKIFKSKLNFKGIK